MSLDVQLRVSPTPHTADAVTALRAARETIPLPGSICAALDAGDPDGLLDQSAYAEALFALDVAARVFGRTSAIDIGAHQSDAALVLDIAVYHLTGAPSDLDAALTPFGGLPGRCLEPTRR